MLLLKESLTYSIDLKGRTLLPNYLFASKTLIRHEGKDSKGANHSLESEGIILQDKRKV